MFVHFWDGASKKGDGCKLGSYGALLRVNGVTVARIAVYVGDHTNNEAEYQGALAVLEHALAIGHPCVRMYGDSKLVVSHLNGTWKCKAANLTDYYERGLSLVRQLQDICADGEFSIQHVYREYNADADSLANIAVANRGRDNAVVVNEAWLPASSLRPRIRSTLSTPGVVP